MLNAEATNQGNKRVLTWSITKAIRIVISGLFADLDALKSKHQPRCHIMRLPHAFLGLAIGLQSIHRTISFGLLSSDVVKAFQRSNDCSTLPEAIFDVDDHDEAPTSFQLLSESTIRISTSFQEQYEVPVETYLKCATNSHDACVELLDRYATSLLRCEEIKLEGMSPQQDRQRQFNVRWEASWISPNSVWLYELAEQIGWTIETKTPDSMKISTSSWTRVLQLFQTALQTGTIVLPRYSVEGNTRFRLMQDRSESQVVSISLEESIDLVEEADSLRLQNRVVAQEIASWLDVSRKPPNSDEVDWASTVRQRILANVPGAGALDVDPNEDGPEVLFAFFAVCIISVGILYQTLSGEMMGSQGQISTQCTEAEELVTSSGYLTECFINGDGPFI